MFRYSIVVKLVEAIRAPRTRGVHALSGWRSRTAREVRLQAR